MKQAAFLDRDGTINYDKGYTYKFSEFKFKPGVIKGLQMGVTRLLKCHPYSKHFGIDEV